ncbi:MAG: DUF1801 domain-containing protein [Candidatus Devosia euplotis]|nr:DUF1801 domain-containing protein [Candidatus Devosia euplotis]
MFRAQDAYIWDFSASNFTDMVMVMVMVMASKSTCIEDYIASLSDGVREVFGAVRETIARLVPEAEETIKYDMPTWRMMGTYVIYAAAWKNHIGLYPVYRALPISKRRLRLIVARRIPSSLSTESQSLLTLSSRS